MTVNETATNGTQGPRRKRRPLRILALLIGVCALVLAAVFGSRLAFDPWSLSWPGRSALTGHWQGEVSFGPGDTRQFVLYLFYSGRCRSSCSTIGGDGKVCVADRTTRYQFTGKPLDHHAARFQLAGRAEEDRPLGLLLNALEGEWRGDTLKIQTSLTLIDPDGVSRSDHQPADPPSFEMRRISRSHYLATCG